MSDFVFEVLSLNAEFIEFALALNSDYPPSIVVYFFPRLIALFPKKHNLGLIFMCNLIFGFTGISWFVILLWAFVEPANKPSKPIAALCPHCKELIRPDSKVCHHCHRSVEPEKPPSDGKPSSGK